MQERTSGAEWTNTPVGRSCKWICSQRVALLLCVQLVRVACRHEGGALDASAAGCSEVKHGVIRRATRAASVVIDVKTLKSMMWGAVFPRRQSSGRSSRLPGAAENPAWRARTHSCTGVLQVRTNHAELSNALVWWSCKWICSQRVALLPSMQLQA
jgi:hypothetical protein